MPGKKGFRAPDDFQPWAFDSRVVALLTWKQEDPLYLYDVENRSYLELRSGRDIPCSVQFAPDIDRLLLAFARSGSVYDHLGVHHVTLRWPMPELEVPFVCWSHRGQLLWVGREATDSAPMLRVYSGLDGALLSTERLDPHDAVPYDRSRYENLSRTSYTLRRGHGTWAMGSLLDRWDQIRFDRSANRLLLSILRPVSEPYQEWPGLVCDVEERWVAATLDAGVDASS